MINVFDIETYCNGEEIVPYCLGSEIKEKNYVFYYPENVIINFLDRIVNIIEEEKIEIYAHNLNFDGILVINEITKNNIKFTVIAKKNNIYAVSIAYCNKTIILKCSYKIIPMSLRDLGEIEGFEKKYFPYAFVNKNNLLYDGEIPLEKYWENNDYKLFIKTFNKKNNFNLKNIAIDYCLQDIKLTKRVLNKLFKIIKDEDKSVLNKSLSAPSISHKLYYLKYNNIKIEQNIKTADDIYIRNAYYGGRCEVFGNPLQDEHIKYYDFSGMYAQCMMEFFHSGKGKYEIPTEIKKVGFYNINYKSDIKFLPVLPEHNNGKLVFMNGEGSGTFWYEEILLFIKMGGVVLKINNAYVYENKELVFENFVNKFTKIREKGGYYKIWGKLMINSLYGSMALQDDKTVQFLTFSEKEFLNIQRKTNVETFYKINDCYVLTILEDYRSRHFFKKSIKRSKDKTTRNISYAAAITSKARVKLYNALMETIEDTGKLLYCDTDSIFAAYPKSDVREKTKFFSWIATYDQGLFINPKTYALKKGKNEIIKIKGIKEKNTNFETMKENFLTHQTIEFTDQNIFKKSKFKLTQSKIIKRICLAKYDKRIFVDNMTNTIPNTK